MPPLLSSSPAFRRIATRATRGRALLAGVAIVVALAAAPLVADTIPLNNAEVRIEEENVLLNADFEVTLTPTLEEALQRGIPLYFVLDVEIVRPRWYWFDEKAVQNSTQYRISYQPLTRQYRVASGLLSQVFDTLDEVERFLGRVTARTIARVDQFERGARYEAVVRLRLDVNQLPKPFQVNALASREWQLASESRRIPFVP